MSRATREQVFSALFAQLQTVPGLVTCSRRLQNAQDMNKEDMPAAFQLQGKQTIAYKGSVPAANDMTATWALYGISDDPDVAPSTVLNNLVDAACAAIAPPPYTDKQTLGGLVEYAAIDGDIEIFEGLLGDRSIALIPIRIILAGF
jgi:hypothetical protein